MRRVDKPQKVFSKHARATRFDREPFEVLDWHEHHNLSLCFVIKGDYEETTRNRTYNCRPGDVVVKTPDLPHLNKFGQAGAVCLLLEISDELLECSTRFIQPEFRGPVHSPQLARVGLELCEEMRIADQLSPFMLEGLALRSLVSMLRIANTTSHQRSQVDAMRELLDAGAGVEDLTQKCLSTRERKSARRLFHEMVGCSLDTYVLRRRAFHAFDELLNTDHSLAEIAHRTGFYDQAHFTRVFATLFGVTPGRLRSRIN